jgi:hypothetical protein
MVMANWQCPTTLSGNFNIVRNQREKRNGVIKFNLVSSFNEWINTYGLIDIKDHTRCSFNEWINTYGLNDIKDHTRSFTWSNNQQAPIIATLDRILVTIDWEAKYPMAKVNILSKGATDHDPLKISFGEKVVIKEPIFRFKKWWLEREEFAHVVKKVWDIECPYTELEEVWQYKMKSLWKKVKGWSKNLELELKKIQS